jgi:hypothetical protein
MDPVIISWTPTNWATIFLMALGGFLIVKCVGIVISRVATGAVHA